MVVAPTQGLVRVVLVAAVAIACASFLGLGATASNVALMVVALVVMLDLILLRRRPEPAVVVRVIGNAVLRRTYELDVTVQGAGVTEVVPDVPLTLGGPLTAALGVRRDGVVSFALTPRRRGLHNVESVWVRQESPLRLLARRRVLPVTCKIDVLPDLLGPNDDGLGSALLETGSRASLGLLAAGGELRALRPFQSGDDPRHVDWKATARLSIPIVREWLPDRRRSVLVVLDAGRLMRAEHDGESKFDAALRGVVRLAMAAEARGDRVGMLVYADKPLRRVPPLDGVGQAGRLLRYVNDLVALPAASDLTRAVPYILEERRRALVVLLTDVIDQAGAQSVLAPVLQVARHHVPLVVLVRDPHLDQALTTDVVDGQDAFRRAAAELVMREREQAQQALRARGVRAIDVSMRSLALDVLQAYVHTREQLH